METKPASTVQGDAAINESIKPRRGRKPDTDPDNDRKISERFKASGLDYADFATKERLQVCEVKKAVDRHRKREKGRKPLE